jgi:hypothetical protein
MLASVNEMTARVDGFYARIRVDELLGLDEISSGAVRFLVILMPMLGSAIGWVLPTHVRNARSMLAGGGRAPHQ